MKALFNNTYLNRRVLVTGNTGFKGSWLTLWLNELGADVLGYALPPDTIPNHFDHINLKQNETVYADIRNNTKLEQVFSQFKPEIVFHLAAQPLVLKSYSMPTDTWDINLNGTLNVLEACKRSGTTKSIVVITTDKVYENKEQLTAYCEDSPLGGYDPYSASKAACEILIQSYQSSFFQKAGVGLASARAGNVIGGGDWSENRLIPDIIRASVARKSTEIRMPNAIRPWQHVLDSISGYLLLGQKIIENPTTYSGPWNFGPSIDESLSVSKLLIAMQKNWPIIEWHEKTDTTKHEMNMLLLDSNKATSKLDWHPVWRIQETLLHTSHWYRTFYETEKISSLMQIHQYITDAKKRKLQWAKN